MRSFASVWFNGAQKRKWFYLFQSDMLVIREIADIYQDFFNFMSQEHDLTLTIGQMNDIKNEAMKLEERLRKTNRYESITNQTK
jgi:mannose/cellobiose epimerase-like protein (N-acyl-D-glucosamine 2-epimerase family)